MEISNFISQNIANESTYSKEKKEIKKKRKERKNKKLEIFIHAL
jgi:rRNA processing protein Gar1